MDILVRHGRHTIATDDRLVAVANVLLLNLPEYGIALRNSGETGGILR